MALVHMVTANMSPRISLFMTYNISFKLMEKSLLIYTYVYFNPSKCFRKPYSQKDPIKFNETERLLLVNESNPSAQKTKAKGIYNLQTN